MLNPTGMMVTSRMPGQQQGHPGELALQPSPRAVDAKVVSVSNPKSGTARTTTAVFLAHALAQRGQRVILVDADPEATVVRWGRLSAFPFPTVAAPVHYLHTLLPGGIDPDADYVIIDTPARRRHAAVRLSAMRAADLVIVPMAPTTIEVHTSMSVYAEIDIVARRRGLELPAVVLLNRAVTQAASTDAARVVLAERAHRVLTPAVPFQERYAQAFGGAVTDVGVYAQVAAELLAPSDTRRPRLACAPAR